MDPLSRLPTSDPRYRYPPSRNPYWKKIRDLSAAPVLTDQETETIPGFWRKRFSELTGRHSLTEHRLTVEIGCNGGHLLTAMAERHPDELFIGLDWKYKQIHRAFEKAQKKELQNTIFLRAHAERLPFVFGEGEIDQLLIYFPDPWEKRSQKGNRFIQAPWLEKISPLLSQKGTIHFKTDHADYFEFIEAEVLKCNVKWRVLERTRDLHETNPKADRLELPDVTLFEKLFIKDGLPIHSLRVQKEN